MQSDKGYVKECEDLNGLISNILTVDDITTVSYSDGWNVEIISNKQYNSYKRCSPGGIVTTHTLYVEGEDECNDVDPSTLDEEYKTYLVLKYGVRFT